MSVPAAFAIRPVRGERLLPPLRRQSWPASEGGVSLVLHLAVVLALALFVLHQHLRDQPGGEAIAVVMEGGQAQAVPKAVPESRRSAPSEAPNPLTTEAVPPGASQPSAAQPAGSTPASQARAEQTEAPPTGAVPVPSRPVHVARPRLAQSGNPFASLSAPMALSLAGRPPPPASEGHLQRGLLLTMAPTAANQSILTRYAEARHALGEDWWAAFSDYVEQHKYYPLAAARHGEDGQSVLRMTVDRDGTVEAVRVEISSGSQTLDMAWVSAFRGKKVPAFPAGTTEDKITFSASMTYILEQLGP